MKLDSLLSCSNMLLGGTIIILISIITWHFSWQITAPAPAKLSGMALKARTVMVTGSSRGLGLEYVKQLVKLPVPPEVVIAACRDPKTATNLQEVANENPAVKIVKLDVEKDEEVDAAYKVKQPVFPTLHLL